MTHPSGFFVSALTLVFKSKTIRCLWSRLCKISVSGTKPLWSCIKQLSRELAKSSTSLVPWFKSPDWTDIKLLAALAFLDRIGTPCGVSPPSLCLEADFPPTDKGVVGPFKDFRCPKLWMGSLNEFLDPEAS